MSLSDHPLATLAQDELGRRRFCETLASTFLLPAGSPSKVISVEGSWGEGKSSAIEMALDVVGRRDADQKPFVVRINPWQVGSKDALVRAMLLELAVIVRSEQRVARNADLAELSQRLLQYSDALSFLKAEPTSWTLVQVAKLLVGVAAFRARKLLDLESHKARVSEAIDALNRPLVVVIDDIDRLLPVEVVEVVRFVRAVGNFSRTAYILAFDHDRVVEALHNAGVPSAEKFLEKIVQLRISLPPIRPAAIRKILSAELEGLPCYVERRQFSESAFREIELYDYYLSPLISDVRSLIRILDRVRVLPATVTRDVEFWDVFAASVIAIVAPPVFEVMRRFPHELTGGDASTSLLPADRAREPSPAAQAVDQVLSTYPIHRRAALRGLLSKLFPLLDREGSSRPEKWHELNGRIGAARPLFTYLDAGLEDGRISLDLARRVVWDGFLPDLDTTVGDEARLTELADLMRQELELGEQRTPLGHAQPLAKALFLHWRLLEGRGVLSSTESEQPRVLIPLMRDLVVRAPRPTAALRHLQDADSEGLFSAFVLDAVNDMVISQGSGAFPALEKEPLTSAVTKLSASVERYIRSGAAQAEKAGRLLFVLWRLDRSMFNDVVDRAAGSRGGRRLLISALGAPIISGTRGPVASWPDDLLDMRAADLLRAEAKDVVKETTKDKRLLMTAKALADGEQYVIETGERYRR